MNKIMDFCGSGKILDVLLSDDCFRSQLCEEIAGRKVTMMIFAEDDKTTLQGNDLSVQFDEPRIDVIGQNGNEGEHYRETMEWKRMGEEIKGTLKPYIDAARKAQEFNTERGDDEEAQV